MRIFIVDDGVSEIETLRRGLRMRGHQVVGAWSAREAPNAVETGVGAIDLVLTDHVMPMLNGI
jgi:CheY-like chemotaxis protein